MADAVAPHRALRPLAAVRPPAAPLHAQPVPLPRRPLPRELAAVRPPVDAARLEARRPRARVLALALRSRADAVPVRAALVRAAAVRPAVVKVEMADGRRGRAVDRRGGGRTHRPGDDGNASTPATTGRAARRAIGAATERRFKTVEDDDPTERDGLGNVRPVCADGRKSGASLASRAPAEAGRRPPSPWPVLQPSSARQFTDERSLGHRPSTRILGWRADCHRQLPA